MGKTIILIYFLCLSSLCIAQKKIIYDNQQWFQYSNQLQFSEKFTQFTDIGVRRINDFKNWSMMAFRTGFGYRITENLQGVTGILLADVYASDIISKAELRGYEELNTKQSFGKVLLQHKLRIEGRYFRGVTDGKLNTVSSFNFRFRYKINCAVPLVKISKADSDKQLLLNLGEEVFVNAGNTIVYNVFDNNRLSAGLVFQLGTNLNLTLTYIYQYGQRSAAGTYESSDIVFLSLTQKMALRKKKELNVKVK